MEYDIVILGTGPAGLQAAIHASRRKVRVLVLGKQKHSSLHKTWVENFCCLENTSTKSDLLNNAHNQAKRAGAEILEEDVLKTEKVGLKFKIRTEGGKEILSRSLIIATGVSRNKLNVKGERELLGQGASYCVGCDAPFFTNKTVAIVGCGSAAASGALVLTNYANKVYLICESLDVDEKLKKQIEAAAIHPIIDKVSEIKGDQTVNQVVLEDHPHLAVDGIFIELGAKGSIELASNLGVILDEKGFIVTDKDQKTNVEGVFAAGDTCGPPFQVAKAVGEGCVAGLSAVEYVKRKLPHT
ncbi:NAD(P)/FAD-dependent oxidoreductase [[Eubacterium] cellulosolvens]